MFESITGQSAEQDSCSNKSAQCRPVSKELEARFGQAFRQSYDNLLNLAKRYLHDQDDAEDVVIDGALKTYRRLHTYEGKCALSTWLHQGVVWASLQKLQKNRRQYNHVDPFADVEKLPSTSTPYDHAESSTLARIVEGDMQQLTPVLKDALELEMSGANLRQLCRENGTNYVTMRGRVCNARKKLAGFLRDDPGAKDYPVLMKKVMDERYDRRPR
jgi:RNA polymerase sigma-70 factor (ECF subfamily)